MNKYILGATVALAAAVPAAAVAQQLPPAVVAVVDTDRIFRTCTACAAAQQQLQAQVAQLQQRAQQLGLAAATPNALPSLEAEAQAIQNAVNALAQGQQPDAALQARAQTFQTNLTNAQREIATRQEQIQRNSAFVRQQIAQRIQPAIVQVMQQRGANLAVDRDSGTLAINPALDVTDAVLALVNQNASPLNVNAPPPQQQPAAQPQQPQQQRPRPPGR